MTDTKERDRAATRAGLLQAVGTLIAEEGFGAVGVNAVARRAGSDKVLIYRYFGGLPGLLAAYAEEGDFWWRVEDLLAEPLPPADEPAALARTLERLFERHAAFLRAHPVTLEVIAWEMSARNELTAALESVREARSLALLRRLAARFAAPEAEFLAQFGPALALLGGAANYLAARGRRPTVFAGVELDSDAGWERLRHAAAGLLAGLCREYEGEGK